MIDNITETELYEAALSILERGISETIYATTIRQILVVRSNQAIV